MLQWTEFPSLHSRVKWVVRWVDSSHLISSKNATVSWEVYGARMFGYPWNFLRRLPWKTSPIWCVRRRESRKTFLYEWENSPLFQDNEPFHRSIESFISSLQFLYKSLFRICNYFYVFIHYLEILQRVPEKRFKPLLVYVTGNFYISVEYKNNEYNVSIVVK